jgi:hypothetical protein
MITRPSAATLLEVICEELNSTVAPAVTDAGALQALAMIGAVVKIVANRCDHEIGWMVEEIATIEALCDRVIDGGHDVDGSIAAKLLELRSATVRYDAAALTARYSNASELLSKCLETTILVGGEIRVAAEGALKLRADHEASLRGVIEGLVGRG